MLLFWKNLKEFSKKKERDFCRREKEAFVEERKRFL
jgi:hypothetical protein